MSEPHERLDQAMKDRLLEIKKRWTQIASEAGVTTSALGAIRRGEYRPSPLTARGLEDAFEWEHGSLDALYAGSDPKPIDPVDPHRPDEPRMSVADLAQRVAELERANAEQARVNEETARRNEETARRNEELARRNEELARLVRERLTQAEKRRYGPDNTQRNRDAS